VDGDAAAVQRAGLPIWHRSSRTTRLKERSIAVPAVSAEELAELIRDGVPLVGGMGVMVETVGEGTVQWLLHRRMGANQQMRWSPSGAHLMAGTCMGLSLSRGFHRSRFLCELRINRGRSRGAVRLRQARPDRVR
jgi:hypothetical protein